MATLVKFGNTSNRVRFFLIDSTSASKAGLTGIAFNSTGLVITVTADNEAAATVYSQSAGTIEAPTVAGVFQTPTANKCRFKEIANGLGEYEFQFADSRYAVIGARSLAITVSGVANLSQTNYEIQLVQFDPYEPLRMGLLALPAIRFGRPGGLFGWKF